jgi:DNA-binding response OmpR family regulator
MARDETFDLAVLDVNLANEESFEVAKLLLERSIPFLFATGYGLRGLDERFQKIMTLQKPFESHQLADAISFVLASRCRQCRRAGRLALVIATAPMWHDPRSMTK